MSDFQRYLENEMIVRLNKDLESQVFAGKAPAHDKSMYLPKSVIHDTAEAKSPVKQIQVYLTDREWNTEQLYAMCSGLSMLRSVAKASAYFQYISLEITPTSEVEIGKLKDTISGFRFIRKIQVIR